MASHEGLPLYQCTISWHFEKPELFYYKFICPNCKEVRTHGAGNGSRSSHCTNISCPKEYYLYAEEEHPLYNEETMGPRFTKGKEGPYVIDPYHSLTALNQHCIKSVKDDDADDNILPTTTMTTENNRVPLTSISTNGTYKLKLIKPKFEKVKQKIDLVQDGVG